MIKTRAAQLVSSGRPPPPGTVFLKRKQVEAKCAISRSTIYDLVSKGQFPAPVELGPQSIAWIESEVEEWQRQRIRRRILPPRTTGQVAATR